jgi:flagellar hook-basal body complex protein FliE
MRRVKILKVFFVVILFIAFILYANFTLIKTFFIATLTFNIPIVTVFLLAVLVIYQSAIRLTMLAGTFGIIAYKKGPSLEFYLSGVTKIMPATIAHMFTRRAKKGVIFFSEQEAKDVTEWLENQFFKEKGYTAFFVGTSLTLGLLGTFAGLLVAIDQMGKIILSFGGDNIDMGEVMTAFSGPLGGMAIGFASSLFGVTSAIILNLMQYILTKSQAAFLEDVQEWMKGRIVESQAIDTIEDMGATKSVVSTSSNDGMASAGFLDIFVDTIGDFTEKMEHSNNLSQDMFKKIADKLEQTVSNADNESILLKNLIEVMKESNVNQYSSSKLIEESLQEISTVILSEHKTIKKSLLLQEENNKLLVQLINTLEKKENSESTR